MTPVSDFGMTSPWVGDWRVGDTIEITAHYYDFDQGVYVAEGVLLREVKDE